MLRCQIILTTTIPKTDK
uniref:Uncharacterized protein n=1 Tax=Anguilla anguilla TaxID=7936 RepID=A0A0E9TWQ7_ANGAN